MLEARTEFLRTTRGQSILRYFNVDAFRQVTRTMGIGTSPIGVVRGPGINNFDVSMFKNIAPKEGMRIQFGAPAFGTLTDARAPRVIQLRVRFSF